MGGGGACLLLAATAERDSLLKMVSVATLFSGQLQEVLSHNVLFGGSGSSPSGTDTDNSRGRFLSCL